MYPILKLVLDGDIPVNSYIIERGGECYIIDPGYQKEKIVAFVQEQGYSVRGILLTHAHMDHVEALDCFPVPVFLHELELEVLMDNAKNGFDYFGKIRKYDVSTLDVHTLTDGSILKVGQEDIKVIHTPGHTAGSVCYWIGQDLYTGDTLFNGSVGRWDRPTGNFEQLRSSVLKLIDVFPETTIIHPAHGKSTTVALEKLNNLYVREWNYQRLYKNEEK